MARLGPATSALDSGHLGLFASPHSRSKLGPVLPALDPLRLGAAPSLRSSTKVDFVAAATDLVHFNSSPSTRHFCRLGTSVSIASRVEIGSVNTYMKYDTALEQVEFWVQTYRGLSVNKNTLGGGGILHGVWFSDNMVYSSDRRLKRSIRPLVELLDTEARISGSHERGAQWALRELRPVSYKFKSGAEAKMHRFGFIAQEVENVLPQVIRKSAQNIKGIAYQDLIALLVAAVQSLQGRIEAADVEGRLRHLEEVFSSYFAESQALETDRSRHPDPLDQRLASIEARLDNMERWVEGKVAQKQADVREDAAGGNLSEQVMGRLHRIEAALESLLRSSRHHGSPVGGGAVVV